MARSGTLRVRIIGDSAPFQRTLNGLGKKVAKFGRAVAAAGVVAAGAMVKLGVDSVRAASDLEQSVGAIESVFGPAAARIKEFGDTAAESFGLSRREVNETAAILGAQLQSMGFSADGAADQVIGLQERAADMAATFGGTTREALESIASLMRGERDPIEKYGVAIKQSDVNARLAAEGLSNLEGEAKKQAEAQAALSLLFDQTANSAGQFARESDTLAGKQARLTAKFENLRAELGQKLMPIAMGLFSGLTSMVDRARPVLEAFFAGFTRNVNSSADAVEDGREGVVRFGRKMREVFEAVAGWVRRFISEEVVPRVVRFKDAVAENADRIGRIFDNIGRIVSAVATTFSTAFSDMVDDSSNGSFTIENVVDSMLTVIEGISDTVADVTEFVERNWPMIQEAITPVLQALTGDFRGFETAVKAVFARIGLFVAQKMAEVANAVIDTINGALAHAASVSLPGIGSLVGEHLPKIPRVDVPSTSAPGPSVPGSGGRPSEFHTGGRVTASLPRSPGLRSDERMITAQVGEEVVPKNRAGRDGGGPTIIIQAGNVVGSEQELIRLVQRGLREYNRRAGTTAIA